MRSSPFGQELRRWRAERGMSQLALALKAGTTSRYVSFLETGRSRPGRDVVLRLADALDVPMRARNHLLTAAGLPPSFEESGLDAERMKPLLRIVDRLFERHLPYPAWLVDGTLHVVRSNAAAKKLFPGIDRMSAEDAIDMWFAPGPFRTQLANWASVAWVAFDSMRRDLLRHPSPQLEALVARAEAHLQDTPRPEEEPGLPVLCPAFRVGDEIVRTVTTAMRFEHPTDLTAAALRVELMFPADEVGERFFRTLYET